MLNELSDVISDAALYLPFALVAPSCDRRRSHGRTRRLVGEMTGVVGQTIGITGAMTARWARATAPSPMVFSPFFLPIGLGGAGFGRYS